MSKRYGDTVGGPDHGIKRSSLPDNNPTNFPGPRHSDKGRAFSSVSPRNKPVKGGFARTGSSVKDGTRGSSRGETGRWPR